MRLIELCEARLPTMAPERSLATIERPQETELTPATKRGLAHKKSSLDEYYDILQQTRYGEIPGFVDDLKMIDRQTGQLIQGADHIEKSADGNVVVYWKENQRSIMLFGIASKGKIGSGAAPAMNRWINMLVEKLSDGKVLFTSPHEMTEKILDKIIERAGADGVTLQKKNIGPPVSFYGQQFQNMAVFSPDALQLAGGAKALGPMGRFLT